MLGDNVATTFKIHNGDVINSGITGRPTMIGNNVGESDVGKAHEKCIQDLQRSLSINRLRDGSGAGISELVGTLEGGGFGSVSILIKTRIRSMFTAIQNLQRKRLSVRPPLERFDTITNLIVTQNPDRTSYRFRVDTRTVVGQTIPVSGRVTP